MVTCPAPLPDPAYVEVDGVAIATYVLAAETHSQSDVVLCHGTPWSSRVWAETAGRLRRRHTVHLWDMPGYGRSPADGTVPLDLGSQATRLAGLLSRWRLERPTVVAHDVGAAVALGAHLRSGVDYSRLVLWDSVLLEPWGSPFFRLVSEHQSVFRSLPGALHAALVRAYVAGASVQTLTDQWLDALVEPWLGLEGQAAFYRQIAELRVEDTRPLAARLAEVRCEVMIGWGEQDPWLPVGQAGRLRHLLPGDRPVAALAGCGHLAPVEDPEGVRRALQEWIG